ncbi:MAG: hypothetical protein AB8B61_05150 [Cyclobacteriaceae bacterium]
MRIFLLLASLTFGLVSCNKSLKAYHWTKEKMSFISLKYPKQNFIREVDYHFNKVKNLSGQKIEDSEEGALIFEGFKINYELVKCKDHKEVFNKKYINKIFKDLEVLAEENKKTFKKEVLLEVKGQEHDYVAHILLKNAPYEVLFTARSFSETDNKLVEKIFDSVVINEAILSKKTLI